MRFIINVTRSTGIVLVGVEGFRSIARSCCCWARFVFPVVLFLDRVIASDVPQLKKNQQFSHLDIGR